ncbi:hypothetical protein BZM27_32865 [Paraburkholderia steynii]|uniref:Uncharacterized protein n=1 Tax=Paraburkholderia steynii TaxID=1245441 RepID=A0A4R0X5U3_9BURK|nr:hypothetical protein BZM27_32865 [Paraburkholderia steynii]
MGPLLLAGLLAVIVVCYVHLEIPKFTRGATRREVAHGVLIATGCAFGTVSAWMPGLVAPRWLAFAAGFGIVHVPAAAILLIRYWRGSGQS